MKWGICNTKQFLKSLIMLQDDRIKYSHLQSVLTYLCIFHHLSLHHQWIQIWSLSENGQIFSGLLKGLQEKEHRLKG